MTRDLHSASEMVTTLTRSHRVADFVERSRSALLEFFAGAAGDWGKRELAEWLAGSYARAVMVAPRSDVAAPSSLSRVATSRVEELVNATRETLVAKIPWAGPRASLIGSAVDARLVVACVDVDGARGWVAVARRAPLLARVEALVAVDALARPLDYRDRLVVCKRCGGLSFDAEARAKGECRTHVDSGIVPRRGKSVAESVYRRAPRAGAREPRRRAPAC